MTDVRDPLYMPTMDEALRFIRSNPQTSLDMIVAELAKLSPERILKTACEPWERGRVEPPDYESPLYALYEQASLLATELLADQLGVQVYAQRDGSESFEGDLGATLAHIVTEYRAEQIYNGWADQPEFVPWVPGGNSDKQFEARDQADDELHATRKRVVIQKGDAP